ncbi:TOG array regulator of axonemal microtubules 1 [Pelobates cultripes]|uniref:TOG array regulator of axonemal microtubules 1 n=2 Tax=Pelobates cultripes TaxID=61616 RepID=A0AAD1TKB3_PELCU|nr:TOG array regulator of axonemal microtubules 1 [Pelobates cultripes]
MHRYFDLKAKNMEVHISRVAPFRSKDDSIAQIPNGSAGRRSCTQDSFYYDLQGEMSIRKGSVHSRPPSYNPKSCFGKTGPTQEELLINNSNLRCGIIPAELHSRLLDMKDYKARTHAIEELKYLIKECDFSFISHNDVVGLISFLRTLLDDQNFTVVLVTLDALNCFVINLGHAVGKFLRPVISSTVKLLGDSKITIKEEYMKIYMKLMKLTGPYKVLTILLENLKHKNSRVREEIVNICIASLLTYPSEDFDLPFLACEIAPCLIDSKRKVRHAALEAFAVLAASIGPGKSSLLKAVDEVELQENGDGLMNAVQARLARKTLPKVNSLGLVEYALPCPSSAHIRGNHHLPGADTDWILPESRTQSGQYGDHNGRTTLPHIDPLARRMLSAGKGKNKFPWDNHHPEALEIFPRNQTPSGLEPDQLSSRFDMHHTPVVKTPTAKTRHSVLNQSNSIYSITPDPLAAVTVREESPVLLKAALVRVPSTRKDLNRSKPMPPITKAARSLPDIHSIHTSHVLDYSQVNDEFSNEENIVLDLLDLSLKDDDEDREEMISSLRNVRNSAAKKRAKISGSLSDLESPDSTKMELNLDSPSLTSSPVIGSYRESGIYSMESVRTPLSPTPPIKKPFEMAAVSKPKVRPPRLPSSRNKDGLKKTDSPQQGFNTMEKPVTVIGQRMSYRNSDMDTEDDNLKQISPGPLRYPSKDPPKPVKPTRGIPGSYSNFQLLGACDTELSSFLAEDSVAIIGKGVFDTPLTSSQTHSQSSFAAPSDFGNVKQSVQPLAGIYGRAVQQTNSTTESEVKVTISKSARDKMRLKREPSIKELVDYKGSDRKEEIPRERLSHTDPGPSLTEAHKSASDNLEWVGSPPSLRRASSLKRTSVQRSHYKDKRSSASRTSELMDPVGIQELARPESSMSEAFRLLEDDDWEKKIEGLGIIRSLCAFHSDVVIERLHDVSIAIANEVKNLRSSVSRVAIACLGDMFTHLKKNMDHELENGVRVLLRKAGESNVFIREDVDKALDAMVQSVTPVRALVALLNGGLSHLNNAVKRCTAQHMCDLVERMGPGRMLSGIKDITDRALPAIAKFAQDGAQETRFFGRKMLNFLMSHPDFDKMLEKYIPTKDLPYLRDLIRNIQQKGVGEIHDTPSARGRRSYHGSVSSLRAAALSCTARA